MLTTIYFPSMNKLNKWYYILNEFKFFLFQTVAELGVVIFTALDYGLKDDEERQLSPALENVIDLMTSAGNVKMEQ